MTDDVVTGKHSLSERAFDPASDGFGFRNPVGEVAIGSGHGPLLRRLGAILYGKGLCFGMVSMALRRFAEQSTEASEPVLFEQPPTPELLGEIRRYHIRQYRPRAVLSAVGDWLLSRGGKPDSVLRRLAGADPHILCFGPAVNRRFFQCLFRAHAVAPYRIETEDEETRVYVYDPNHPGDRGRYVSFRRDDAGRVGSFQYEGFGTRWGWGISLFPLSAIGDAARPRHRAIP
ncbi:MAG TPA: hypothetical protein VF068_15405 [Rubrobacter sp.]